MTKLNLLLAAVFAVLSFSTVSAQTGCPVCTIDLTCDSTPPQPKMCPELLPDDTAGQYYEETFTFYLPQQFDITDPISATVTLTQIEVLAVTGLPAGLSWTAYDHTGASTTTFYPNSNPPTTERGCATICGVPVFPGTYNINVSVAATVDVPNIGTQISQQTLPLTLTIHPDPSSNLTFSSVTTNNCAPAQFTFSPNFVTSLPDSIITHEWDYGNGITSDSSITKTITYTDTGEYVVTVSTVFYEYILTYVSFNALNQSLWSGDVEEPCAIWPADACDPDPYFKVIDAFGVELYTSPEADNNTNITVSNLAIPIDNPPFILHFWEGDPTSADDDLGFQINNITDTGSFSIGINGQTGTYHLGVRAKDTITETDTIRINPLPVAMAPTIFPLDSVCDGDSITFTTSGGGTYQWFSDTTLLLGKTDSFLTVHATGDFHCVVTNSFGCTDTTDTVSSIVIDIPPKPGLFNMGTHLATFTMGPYDYQWYVDGQPISGATLDTLVAPVSGVYYIELTNASGCTNKSSTITMTVEPVGVAEAKWISDIKVYPNPTNGMLNVNFAVDKQTDIIYYITDLSGRAIRSETVAGQFGEVNKVLDLNELGWGAYFLRIKAGEEFFTKKIIVH